MKRPIENQIDGSCECEGTPERKMHNVIDT